MIEEKNILNIFKEAEIAIKEENTAKLKEISDHTIHTASISQDSDNIAVAVIIYSLSKIIERGYIQKDKKKKIVVCINNLISDIEKKEEEKIKKDLAELRNSLEKSSGKMREYIQDVFRKASINKASKIYEHGISMEKTAKLLGISMFELAGYAGQREDISEISENRTRDVHSRIKIIEDFFK